MAVCISSLGRAKPRLGTFWPIWGSALQKIHWSVAKINYLKNRHYGYAGKDRANLTISFHPETVLFPFSGVNLHNYSSKY